MLKLLGSLVLLVGALMLVPEQVSAQDTVRATVSKRRPAIVVVNPRHKRLSANSKRHCEAELVKEVSPRGTYIVPRTTCWWQ